MFGVAFLLAIVFIVVMIVVNIGRRPGTWTADAFSNWTSAMHSAYTNQKARTLFRPTEGGSSSSSSGGELECRRVLESIFAPERFPKARPDFLRNPVTENYNLELDCYNSDLGIAVEYDGAQHAKYTPHFHASIDAFRTQQYRDYIKNQLCIQNGITLIRVPHSVKIEDIHAYILSELRQAVSSSSRR
jgi:hypothetical protein